MYDFKQTEEKILKFWKDNNIYAKLKERNSKGKKFYFLQGPPYTSGKLHMGHAWNHALKDMALRYKRMKGFNVWDRAGYDMHGLPTERAVEKKLGLKSKEDILKLGVDKFTTECRSFAVEHAKIMDKDLDRLGAWLDFENAYYPIETEYIDGAWWLIKQAHKKNRLYEGERTLSWCASCATALAKHEQEYRNVTDTSIFVKFKVKNKHDEYLIIFTTTPWTLAFNLAIMVNPDVDYVKCEVDGEKWIVAKALANLFLQGLLNKNYKILEEFKGSKLKGKQYVHFWENDIPDFKELKQKSKKVHTVVLSKEYVDTTSGTGLVHCAPGCGPEDYEIGHKNKILPFNNINEYGVFPEGMGRFSKLKAKTEDFKFIEALKNDKVLIAETRVEHDYAHCQRCRNPVVFRTTRQWFFKIENLKNKMLRANKKVKWVPESAGVSFASWLENLRDNSITKQRFWGIPVPVWRCESCKEYTVVESREELEKLAETKVPDDLHKPWIDEVTLKCKCGGKQKRIPDVLDVWIDAGTASWNCLYYPHRKDLFEKYWPVDFIAEGKDQIRGWFNLLTIAGTLAFDKAYVFKNCYMHGFITDVEGTKMSKSLGNIISPYEIVDKYGADTLRHYICSTPAGEDINFSFDEIKIKYRNLDILHNLSKYLIGYAKKVSKPRKLDIEEKYILSRLNSTIEKVTELLESYQLDQVPQTIEDYFLELSRTYIQLTRDKKDKKLVYNTIHLSLLETIKIFSVVCPFLTEEIYQELKTKFGLKEESIHSFKWPKPNKKLMDKKLEEHFKEALKVIELGMAERDKAKLGLKWPLAKATVTVPNTESILHLKEIIARQLNVKNVELTKGEKTLVTLDTQLTPELEKEGYVRELTRKIQMLRKKNNLRVEDKIKLAILSDYSLTGLEKEIKKKVGAKTVSFTKKNYDFTAKEVIKNKEFVIMFSKVNS